MDKPVYPKEWITYFNRKQEMNERECTTCKSIYIPLPNDESCIVCGSPAWQPVIEVEANEVVVSPFLDECSG